MKNIILATIILTNAVAAHAESAPPKNPFCDIPFLSYLCSPQVPAPDPDTCADELLSYAKTYLIANKQEVPDGYSDILVAFNHPLGDLVYNKLWVSYIYPNAQTAAVVLFEDSNDNADRDPCKALADIKGAAQWSQRNSQQFAFEVSAGPTVYDRSVCTFSKKDNTGVLQIKASGIAYLGSWIGGGPGYGDLLCYSWGPAPDGIECGDRGLAQDEPGPNLDWVGFTPDNVTVSCRALKEKYPAPAK